MTGYTCAWCGGRHLGLDCPTHERNRGDALGHLCLQYARAERLTHHVRRLRRLVVAMRGAR
jgi:hypothetical protein